MKSSFLLAKSVVPHMETQGAGSIVFISSIGGFHPIPVSDFEILAIREHSQIMLAYVK